MRKRDRNRKLNCKGKTDSYEQNIAGYSPTILSEEVASTMFASLTVDLAVVVCHSDA